MPLFYKCFPHSPHNYVVAEAYLQANRGDFVLVLPLDSKLEPLKMKLSINYLRREYIIFYYAHITENEGRGRDFV